MTMACWGEPEPYDDDDTRRHMETAAQEARSSMGAIGWILVALLGWSVVIAYLSLF